jgi:hypothetical protein
MVHAVARHVTGTGERLATVAAQVVGLVGHGTFVVGVLVAGQPLSKKKNNHVRKTTIDKKTTRVQNNCQKNNPLLKTHNIKLPVEIPWTTIEECFFRCCRRGGLENRAKGNPVPRQR